MRANVVWLLICATIFISTMGWGMMNKIDSRMEAYIESTKNMPRAEQMNRLYELCQCPYSVVNGEEMRKEQFDVLYECCRETLR